MASCVSARLPATSTILIVTGLFGMVIGCAKAVGVAKAAIPRAVALMASVRSHLAPETWDTFIWGFLLLVRDSRISCDVRARRNKASFTGFEHSCPRTYCGGIGHGRLRRRRLRR